MEEQRVDLNNTHAHPRILGRIVESGSWVDDDYVQELWAGLLAASCTPDGKDESNLIFVNLLGQMTALQAVILKISCEQANKSVDRNGLVFATTHLTDLIPFQAACGCTDLPRLDRELDHLRSLGLFQGGVIQFGDEVDLTPTSLGLHFYMRCKGY